jgi:hypothetical protein
MKKLSFLKVFIAVMMLTFLYTACEKEEDNNNVTPPNDSFDFNANYISVISDADMLATAYLDNQLGTKQPENAVDSLSTFLPPFYASKKRLNQKNITNAVTGAVASIDKSKDGKYVFIIEPNKPSSFNNTTTISGLAQGTRLTVVNMVNPSSPIVASTTDDLLFPLSVSINNAGNLLAINELNPQLGGQISFFPVANDGTLGQKKSFPYALLGVPADPNVPAQRGRGLLSFYSQWDPTGNYVAVNFQDRRNLQGEGEVRFFKVVKDGNTVTALEPHGGPQITGKFPFSGRWSPNGKYYLTNDLYWGFDVPQFFITEAPSTITVISFDASQSANHSVLGKTETGGVSEGICINNEGNLVATANMRGSSLLPALALFTRNSSVSLLSFNQNTGSLQKLSELELDGAILPEGISFDNTSENIVIATFDNFQPNSTNRTGKGSIDFIEVQGMGSQKTLKYKTRIVTGRGPHGIVVH